LRTTGIYSTVDELNHGRKLLSGALFAAPFLLVNLASPPDLISEIPEPIWQSCYLDKKIIGASMGHG